MPPKHAAGNGHTMSLVTSMELLRAQMEGLKLQLDASDRQRAEMLDKITRLDGKLDVLAVQRADHTREDEGRFQVHGASISEHGKMLRGDGLAPGILLRLDRIEQDAERRARNAKIRDSILGALFLACVGALWKFAVTAGAKP